MNLNWIDGSLCPRIAWTLMHFLWQGAVIALTTALAAGAVRRSSARLRYVLWTGALIVMAACPPLTFLSAPSADLADEPQPIAAAPAVEPIEPAPIDNEALVAVSGAGEASAAIEPTVSRSLANSAVAPLVALPETGEHALRIATWIVGAYFVGVAALLARMLAGTIGGQRLCRAARPVDEPAILVAIRRQAATLGMRAAPAAAWCQRVAVPAVVGVWRPTVLLPLSLATSLMPDQIDIILLHELAHLRR